VLDLAKQRSDAEFELVDIADYKLPHLDEAMPPSMGQYSQPHTLETKHELVRRYSRALSEAAPLFRFMQENQSTVKELRIGEIFRNRMMGMRDILIDPDAELIDQVRCVSAMFTLHAGMFALGDIEGDPEDKRKAVLEVATDLVTRAHQASHPS